MIRYTQIIVLGIVLLFAPVICEAEQEHLIQGRTMGTTYHVKVVTGSNQGIPGLREKIEKRLDEINQSMSTYIKTSEISRFNDFGRIGEKFKVSDDFYQVMQVSEKIYQISDGAWDGTVNPLVDLWGFGRKGRKGVIPAKSEINRLREFVGFDNIEIVAPGFLIKRRPQISLDLSSIAKGYGVDAVARVLHNEGFENYLVEIGGEVFASGLRGDGGRWRIGINRPRKDAAADEVYKVVRLRDRAFATSGDYRNFFEVNGIRYSHVIDPKTGYPVSNGVVSVSIIADNCTFADGLSTAIMVLGPEKGLGLINRLDHVDGLIVVEGADKNLVNLYSKEFNVED